MASSSPWRFISPRVSHLTYTQAAVNKVFQMLIVGNSTTVCYQNEESRRLHEQRDAGRPHSIGESAATQSRGFEEAPRGEDSKVTWVLQLP